MEEQLCGSVLQTLAVEWPRPPVSSPHGQGPGSAAYQGLLVLRQRLLQTCHVGSEGQGHLGAAEVDTNICLSLGSENVLERSG